MHSNGFHRTLRPRTESQCINYIREHGLNTVTDLEARAKTQQEKLDSKAEIGMNLESRLKEVTELLRQVQNYVDSKLIYDEWYSIKFKGRKERFKTEHDTELRKYYAANRKLKEHFNDGKLPISDLYLMPFPMNGHITLTIYTAITAKSVLLPMIF